VVYYKDCLQKRIKSEYHHDPIPPLLYTIPVVVIVKKGMNRESYHDLSQKIPQSNLLLYTILVVNGSLSLAV
jgi:hypothetical protein